MYNQSKYNEGSSKRNYLPSERQNSVVHYNRDNNMRNMNTYNRSHSRYNNNIGNNNNMRRRSWNHNNNNTKNKRTNTPVVDPLTLPVSEAMPVNLSFGNFETQEMQSVGKRGGGVRELAQLLKQARRNAVVQRDLLKSNSGAEVRQAQLLSAAMQRVEGTKVKDDPVRLSRALAKRRYKKRQSAKKWAKRMKSLHESVENVVKDLSTGTRKCQHKTSSSDKKRSKKGSNKKLSKKEGAKRGKSDSKHGRQSGKGKFKNNKHKR